MRHFIRQNSELAWLAAAIVANLVLCAWLLARNDWLTNVAFLILGALIAVFTTLLSERLRRKTHQRDLASALYVELADRVARCCFDMEAPWKSYLDPANCSHADMSELRIRKFAPDDPAIFTTSASQLALLGTEPAQALARFYYRLAAWRRDVENVATYGQIRQGFIDPKNVQFLAKRLRQTLTPGARALQALAPFVEHSAEIEASSIGSYDEHRSNIASTGTLRERLARLTS